MTTHPGLHGASIVLVAKDGPCLAKEMSCADKLGSKVGACATYLGSQGIGAQVLQR